MVTLTNTFKRWISSVLCGPCDLVNEERGPIRDMALKGQRLRKFTPFFLLQVINKIRVVNKEKKKQKKKFHHHDHYMFLIIISAC